MSDERDLAIFEAVKEAAAKVCEEYAGRRIDQAFKLDKENELQLAASIRHRADAAQAIARKIRSMPPPVLPALPQSGEVPEDVKIAANEWLEGTAITFQVTKMARFILSIPSPGAEERNAEPGEVTRALRLDQSSRESSGEAPNATAAPIVAPEDSELNSAESSGARAAAPISQAVTPRTAALLALVRQHPADDFDPHKMVSAGSCADIERELIAERTRREACERALRIIVIGDHGPDFSATWSGSKCVDIASAALAPTEGSRCSRCGELVRDEPSGCEDFNCPMIGRQA